MSSHLRAVQDALIFVHWILGNNKAPRLDSVSEVGQALIALGFCDCFDGTFYHCQSNDSSRRVIEFSRNSKSSKLPEVTMRLSADNVAAQARIRFDGQSRRIVDSDNLRSLGSLESLGYRRAVAWLERRSKRTRTCQNKPNPAAQAA